MKHTRCIHTFDGAAEIVLRLEEYDDIFSDFDMRPYSHRALSVDFLDEIKRASRDKYDDGIHLALHLPGRRSGAKEKVIKERLSSHFRRHHSILLAERRQVVLNGVYMVVFGVACLVGLTFAHFDHFDMQIAGSLFLGLLEPLSVFLLWEGMDQIIFDSKILNPELDFYKKMSNSRGHICFKSC